jgi:putative peptide zinc metalloprotease protein
MRSPARWLRLDGNTSPDELLEWARETWPSLDFDADFVADVLADVKRYGFIDDPFQRNAMVRAKAREERAQITAATFKNITMIPIGSVNPDRFLTRTYPYVKFLFTPRVVVVGVSLFVLALWVVWTHRVRMAEQAHELASGSGLGLWGYALFMLAAMGAITIHEFGHGYSVKHFGGRVSKIGFLLVFAMPGMYCDTSDSHLFPNWKHRACVALAGTYFELYVAVLATLVWWATPSDLMINKVAYDIIVVASVSGLAFNQPADQARRLLRAPTC